MNKKCTSKQFDDMELKPINNVDLEKDSDNAVWCSECGDSACASCDGVCWIG